ncbi:hypothetical protein [Zavarzinia aquatilis]|uniref:Uncharacterized protein n=1 Tax=Zavarzinia aquatilis TaxID=2211142 RepID=A0A317EC17_9PROT|nr:hypothetical protein [Zavarzinia aquatilis]PWR24597.1 hypothetical protein DKG74_07265 [Zavarzinia aquatilis]
MARPQPTPDQLEASAAEFDRLGRLWGGEHFASSLARALAGEGLLTDNIDNAATTIRRWRSAKRIVPDDVVAWLTAAVQSRPRWLSGSTDLGQAAVVHLLPPRFIAVASDPSRPRFDWIDPRPSPNPAGKLQAEAVERLRIQLGLASAAAQ